MRLFVWWDGERCWYILDWLYCILRYSRSAYAFRSKMVGIAAHHLKCNIKVMSCRKYCTYYNSIWILPKYIPQHLLNVHIDPSLQWIMSWRTTDPVKVTFFNGKWKTFGLSIMILLRTPSNQINVVPFICPHKRPVFPSYQVPW